MKTKLQRCRDMVSENFGKNLAAAFSKKFSGIAIETNFNFVAMRRVSLRSDGKKFSAEQRLWISAYSEGYTDAVSQILEEK